MAEDKIENKAAPKKAAPKKAAPKKAAPKKAAPKKAAPKKAAPKAAEAKIEVTPAVDSKKAPAKQVASSKATVSVTLIKSFYGRLPKHRATVTGLGLKRINHTVVLEDTPEVRGMINKVSYLLKVEG
jgi:large subunit ribosomal protein L30